MDISRIKELADQKGLSIKKIEELCELSNGIIGKWSKQCPNCDNIYKVAMLLDTTIDYLYAGRELSMSESQQQLLELYNQLDDREQGLVMGYLTRISEEHKNSAAEKGA